jgi:copper transport protein
VQVTPRSITILAPSGRDVVRGPIHDDGIDVTAGMRATERGTYLVRWSVISIDTHPASGSFVFAVGKAGGIWAGAATESGAAPVGPALQALGRLLHFAGYALSFGTLAFALVVRQRGQPRTSIERRLSRLVAAGIALLLLAEPMALLAQMASLGTGDILDGDVASAVMASSFGRALAQRLGAAMLLWALMGMVKAGIARAAYAALALGVALAAIDAEAGHANGVLLAVGATVIHLVAMGVWIGGLAALLGCWGLIEPDQRGAILFRFGRLAAGALILLALSGVLMASQRLAYPGDLLATAYGRTLAAKTAAACGAVALARLGMRARPPRQPRWWRWELAALFVVLALAGLLVSLASPK